MDEQIQQLLQEADRKNYSTAQKEELVQWYLNNETPKEPANSNDYLINKYKGKKETTPGALTQLATSAWSAITDQLPGGFAAGRASSESAIADSDKDFEDSMVLTAGDVPYTLAGEGFNADAYRAKVLSYQKTKLGDAEFEKKRREFKDKYKQRAVEQFQESETQDKEAREKTKGNTTEWSQVKNVGDVIRYASSAVGEGIGSSIPAALTAGTSAYAQEAGGAYKEAVEQTAKALTEQYGEIFTPETVIKLGYDKPAQEYSQNVALVNTGLEMVGLLSVFGKGATPFAKKAAKEVSKSALKQGLKTVGTGTVGEGVTEFLQESATQYGALKAAGHSDSEIFGEGGSPGLFDWGRSIEAGVRGGIGGAGLSTISAGVEAGTATGTPETKVGDPKIAKQELKLAENRQKVEEKLAEKEGERQATKEKVEAITNEATDETLNEGTEEDVDQFANSIVELIGEKERNDEILKIEEETTKLEEEKSKIVEKAVTKLEKQEAKDAKEIEQTKIEEPSTTEPTGTEAVESTVQGTSEPIVNATAVQPEITKASTVTRKRGRPTKAKVEPVVAEIKVEKPKPFKAPSTKMTKVEEPVIQDEATQATVRELQVKKAEIVNKYGDTPQYDARGILKWDPKDSDEVRDINKQIRDLSVKDKKANRTPEEQSKYEYYKVTGLDEDAANALTDADKQAEIKPSEMGFTKTSRTERVKQTWKDIKELKVEDYIKDTKESMPKEIRSVWGNAIDNMTEVITKALSNEKSTFRVFEADPAKEGPNAALGMAYLDGGNFYIVNSRDQKQNTKVHELAHVFEFAINQVKADSNSKREVIREIDALHKDVVKAMKAELRGIRKVIGRDPKGFKEAFDKLSNEQKLSVLYAAKGDLSRFSMKMLDVLDEQLAGGGTYPVYGFTNGFEMVAEAMANPYFTALLANLKTTTNGRTVSLLERVYKAFEALLNNLSTLLKENGIVTKYNVKLPSYTSFKNSYLNKLLETLEDNLTDLTTEDGDVMNEILDLPQLPDPNDAAAKKRSTSQINKEISKKIYERAIKSGIDTLADFKAFVTSLEDKSGKKLESTLKRGLTRKFNTFLKRLKLIDERATVFAEAAKSEKWDTPDFRRVVGDLKAIDVKSLSVKDRDKYVSALEAVRSQDNERLSEIRNFVQSKAADKAVTEIVDPKTGVGFREFNKFMKAVSADNLVNLPTFIGYISKYSQEKAPVLMKYFHDMIGEAYKSTSLQVNIVISGLNKIAIKNNLDRTNFSRIYLYGQLISENPTKPQTLEEKYNAEKFALQTTMKAIKKSHETEITEREVVVDMQLLDQIYQQLVAGEEILSEGEKEYYADLRDILDSNLETIRDNSEITWGQKFTPITNYLPKSVKGAIPMPVKGDATDDKGTMTKNIALNDSDLLEIMNPGADYQPLRTSESGFHFVRTGGRGVYYDTNIHNIMAKYLQSTLFNVNAGYQVQKLNKMFKGNNAIKLEDELGVRNTAKLLNFLKSSIKYSKRASTDYSNVTRFLLDAKNAIQTAKIGTSGQFITQLLPMIPATAALTGYNNTMEAIKFMWKTNTDPNLREDFRNLIGNYSSQLAIRDFFFEKYETVEDIAKEGTAGRLRRAADVIEKSTVTKIMGWSDRTATQLTFLSAFIEAGGDMKDQSTWTPERIAKAELKTAQLQNISSPIFAPEALRVDNSKSALVNAALWSFKSFSLNGMMNFILSTPDALMGNTEARKIATAHATSAIGFEIASKAVKAGYVFAAFGLAKAFGYEPPERKKDEDWLDYIKGVLTNGFYSLFFGGMPSYADNAMRYLLNSTAFKWLYGEDSPLYSASKVEELPGKAIGPFEELYTLPLNTVDYMSDYVSGDKMSEEKTWELFGKIFAEGIMFTKIIPFRGDVAKTIRSGTSEKKSIKYDNKKNKTRRRRKKQYY